MKEMIIGMFMLLYGMASMAQNSASENLTGEWIEGNEVQLRITPKIDDCYGIRYGMAFNKWLNGDIVVDNVFSKNGVAVCRAGVGPGGKYSIGPLLFTATVFPYAALRGTSEEGKSETKFDFTYGAMAHAGIGIKISKKCFISGSYSVESNEFRTKGLFEYGTWQIGITLIE